ncbi:MAG: inositol monophosphatase family protein [Pseudomonadales bacterium]
MQPMVNIALRAARRAGQMISRTVDRVDELLVEEKSRNDLVSDVDRNAEAIIIETIRNAYPDHSILAEESGILDADGEFRWVIDPLDGTTNFLHGIPHHCTSIAIMQGNVVLHGVTVDHLRNEEFTASRGEGAYLNGRRIRVTGATSLSTSIMASGIPWHSLQKHAAAYEAIYSEFIKNTRGVRQMGSAALDLAYIASGRMDGYFEIGIKQWDMAAGSVLVREAGGFVGDIAGGDRFLETGNIVAANPRIFREILRSIRAAVKASNDVELGLG